MEHVSIDRINCSYRVLIGPLDDKAPAPFPVPTVETSSTNSYQSSNLTTSTTTVKNNLPSSNNETPNNSNNNSKPNSTTTPKTNGNHLQHNEDLDNNSNENNSVCSLDSTHTIKSNTLQSSKTTNNATVPKITISASNTDTDIDNNNNNDNGRDHKLKLKQKIKHKSSIIKKKVHDNSNSNNIGPPQVKPTKTLLWRSTGFVFVPQLSDITNVPSTRGNTNESADNVLKHDVLLCMKMVGHLNGSIPKAYKATREARNLKQKQDWCQLEIVLTNSMLLCYDTSHLLWPKRKLKYKIPLQSQNKSSLSLYLLSPLDYTFCLQHLSKSGKECITTVFRARSITLCQEWYVAIYQLLSSDSKKPFPHECDVFIPTTNLRVQIPLTADYSQQQQNNCHHDNRYRITNDQIKEAILDLLEDDPVWKSSLKEHSYKCDPDRNNVVLCWTHHDRTEWIYWKDSITEDFQIDKFICPQSIEKTHQLELRHIQHTPHNVTLSEGMTLKEPPPVEGFLNLITDFEGRYIKPSNTWTQRRYYFSTFGSYLFYTPQHKTDHPDESTFMDPNQVKIHNLNYITNSTDSLMTTIVTPFPYDKVDLSEDWQHAELRRRMKLMKNASGIINLNDVLYVQRVFMDDIPKAKVYSNNNYNSTESGNLSLLTTSTSPMVRNYDTFYDDSTTSLNQNHSSGSTHHHNPRTDHPSCIGIFMKNGIVLKLNAFSNETCEYWVTCLSNLVVYARARQEVYKDVHKSNESDSPFKKPLNIEHKDYVDTRVWSFCIFDKCQDLAKSGILYIRSSKHPFSQKQFILTSDGWMHYYRVYKRSETNGKPIKTSIYGKKGSIDLANAYVYSGVATALEGSKRKLTPDRPPRLFQNGVTSNDTDQECTFTIWIPKRKRMFSSRRQRIIVHGYENRMNSKGVRWVFLAPSRKERDEWVFSINVIHEQLLREASRH